MKKSLPILFRLPVAFPAVLIICLLTACSDVLLQSEREPSDLIVDPNRLITIVGENFRLNARLVDNQGVPYKNVPGWVDTSFTGISDLIDIKGDSVITRKSGVVEFGIEIAGFFEDVELRIAPRLYMIQSTQRLNRSLRLVEGRNAAIRLFLIDEEKTVRQSEVSVEVYQNGSLVQTLDYPAQRITPLEISENVSTLDLPIPGHYIQTGLAVLINVGNVTYPQDGTPVSLNVTPIPEFHIRLIPITASATGKTGEVNESNLKLYLEELEDMFPVNEVKIDVHPSITVTGDPDDDDTQSEFYEEALRTVRATWLAEGKPDYYYYGVIPQAGGGIVGLGYVSDLSQGAYFRQAVGWDGAGDNIEPGAPETLAHELGHNFGRLHAPCGDVETTDPLYPYPNGSIGTYGYEVDESELKSPLVYKSFMSYCSPTWISDYTYEALLNFHLAVNPVPDKVQQPQDVLLVWGSINDGELSLEPAFRISAPPALPKQSGPYTLSGYDKNGSRLFSISFAGARVSRGNARHFAFAIPVQRVNIKQLEMLRLTARGMQALQRANVPARLPQPNIKALPNISARRSGVKGVSLEWDSRRYKMTMVKNPHTGDILGFVKEGITEIQTEASKLKLYFSDGVHTTTTTVSVQ